MSISRVRGIIRRRILVNFRVDPEIMERELPHPFRPKLLGDSAVAGICLMRLEAIRPAFLPVPCGLDSENAAHRVAVEWTDKGGREREGVYILRRDTSSLMNRVAGGRLFPGEHNRARFRVRERDGLFVLAMRSHDREVALRLQARPATELPGSSRFPSVESTSRFFAGGTWGHAASHELGHLEGVCLCAESPRIEPLAVDVVESTFFRDGERFPPGSVEFDSALIMRDVPHEWKRLADLHVTEHSDRSLHALTAA